MLLVLCFCSIIVCCVWKCSLYTISYSIYSSLVKEWMKTSVQIQRFLCFCCCLVCACCLIHSISLCQAQCLPAQAFTAKFFLDVEMNLVWSLAVHWVHSLLWCIIGYWMSSMVSDITTNGCPLYPLYNGYREQCQTQSRIIYLLLNWCFSCKARDLPTRRVYHISRSWQLCIIMMTDCLGWGHERVGH